MEYIERNVQDNNEKQRNIADSENLINWQEKKERTDNFSCWKIHWSYSKNHINGTKYKDRKKALKS